ncbi:hypothetical protein M426DRAFT_25163 [Hypoxylon sp. CI-4A]|nr:hypothetical protein M426DRAFT_25163 [Hypoxylon sp. CI-4A]
MFFGNRPGQQRSNGRPSDLYRPYHTDTSHTGNSSSSQSNQSLSIDHQRASLQQELWNMIPQPYTQPYDMTSPLLSSNSSTSTSQISSVPRNYNSAVRSWIMKEQNEKKVGSAQNPWKRFDITYPQVSSPVAAPTTHSFQYAPHYTHSGNGYVPMGRGSVQATRYLHPQIWQAQLQATGISHNYSGNIFLESNQSAKIPEGESTSLWITNLPPDCTHQMLLGAVRNCGKVYATVINPPVHNNNSSSNSNQQFSHSTAAAKLVFFYRSGVDRLLAQSRRGQFQVEGYVPHVRMNRILSTEREQGPQSRVLHIEGPGRIVQHAFLAGFFRTKFTFELEAVLQLGSSSSDGGGGYARQEWRFGSYRCQAESARQALRRECQRSDISEDERNLWAEVKVYYAVDPCA